MLLHMKQFHFEDEFSRQSTALLLTPNLQQPQNIQRDTKH